MCVYGHVCVSVYIGEYLMVIVYIIIMAKFVLRHYLYNIQLLSYLDNNIMWKWYYYYLLRLVCLCALIFFAHNVWYNNNIIIMMHDNFLCTPVWEKNMHMGLYIQLTFSLPDTVNIISWNLRLGYNLCNLNDEILMMHHGRH